MKRNISHVTELTRTDLEEMFAAAEMEAGVGIVVDRTGDRIKIGIDENALKVMVWAMLKGGIANVGLGALNTVPTDPGNI